MVSPFMPSDFPTTGVAAAQAPPGPAAPAGLPGLVGRNREFALLRESWSTAAAGYGAIVAVGGEPGIGKTRLLQAIAALAQTRPGSTPSGPSRQTGAATVLWGRCYEGDWTPPYGPW